MALLISHAESSFFIVVFLVLFAVRSPLILLFSAIALFAFFLHKRREIYFLWSVIAPRINGDAPLLKYLLEFARAEGPGNQELNDLMELRVPFMKPFFFIFKPAYIKKVLALEPDNFQTNGEKSVMTKISANSGNNILLLPGPPHPNWLRFREVTSVINKDRFGETSLVGEMVNQAWKTTQELSVKHFMDKQHQSLDLFYELYHIMIPAHNRALFGEEFARKFSHNELNTDLYDVITETGKQLKVAWCPPNLKEKYDMQVRRVTEAVRNMAKGSTSAFMKPIQEAHRKGLLSEEEMISNLMVFEYSQAPLHVAFWLLYVLALHPEEEKKVVAEIATVLAQGPFTRERLSEFKYLTKCLQETLRLYPGVGLMQVRETQHCTQFGSHFVPKGSYVFLCNYLIHRNATYFPNPDEFIPTREGLDPTQYGENLSYIPFGNGPRQCQGQYFAQDFVKVTVISILQHFKVNLAPEQGIAEPTEIGFLRPTFPVYVQFEKRTSLPTPGVVPAGVPSRAPNQVLTSQPSSLKIPKLSKAANLASQSMIFKDHFVSIGKIKNTHDLLVCYGSQTGTARGLATRVVHMAGLCKLSATLVALSDLDVDTVKQYKAVVVVTSTYGDGGAPENAEKFELWLEKETSTDKFSGVPYAVLALGSSMYPFPFRFGNLVHNKFGQLGGEALIQVEKIDEIKYNMQEVFTDWSARLFDAISQKGKVDASNRELVAKNKLLGFQKFDFNVLQVPVRLTFTNKTLKKEPRTHFGNNIIATSVAANVLINSEPTNQIYSVDLKYKNSDLSFHAGDNAIVVPSNPAEQVGALITRLGFEKDKVFNVEGNQELNSVTDLQCSLGSNKCTLDIALTYYYDITTPASASMLQFLSMQSTNAEDQKTLLSYVSNYLPFLNLNLSILDLLEAVPSIQFNGNVEHLSVFLGLLGPIKQRHYSIANFPDSNPNILRIVYKVVSYTSKSGHAKQGLCSNYLKSKKIGEEVMVGVMKSKFRLPEDSAVPIVMVGAGSGISPYFGFVEQRNHNKTNGAKLGKAVLIHGCRSEPDYPNKVLIDDALKSGNISDSWPAYSRKEGVPRTHIQDIFLQQGEEIWNLLNEGAIVYVCGDVNVGMSIRDSLVKVAQTHGKYGAFKANTWLHALIKSGRLRNDEWGIATTSGAHAIRAARLRLWRKSILAIFAFTKK